VLSTSDINEEAPYLPYKTFIRTSNEFKRLMPHQIEDFLCIFHNRLDFAK